MIPMQPATRRMIAADNFAPTEGACSCGCGLLPSDSIILAIQALVLALSREYDGRVRVLVQGGVRCQSHHQAVYAQVNAARAKQGLPPKKAPADSRHLPPSLDALDVRMEVRGDSGRWMPIPLDIVAMWARKLGCFGGIGLTEYQQDGRDIVHLDARPGRLVTW